jgi:hypothetical protein
MKYISVFDADACIIHIDAYNENDKCIRIDYQSLFDKIFSQSSSCSIMPNGYVKVNKDS